MSFPTAAFPTGEATDDKAARWAATIAARAVTYAGYATNLRAFAARQEARAPGRMDNITGPALTAATLADTVAAAYAAGDEEAAKAPRTQYHELEMRDGNVRMGAR